jgi:hypothetical protein
MMKIITLRSSVIVVEGFYASSSDILDIPRMFHRVVVRGIDGCPIFLRSGHLLQNCYKSNKSEPLTKIT